MSEIKTCIGCTESMCDGLMENLRCSKCVNYDQYKADSEFVELKKHIRTDAIEELVTEMKNRFFHQVGTQFDNAILEMEKKYLLFTD